MGIGSVGFDYAEGKTENSCTACIDVSWGIHQKSKKYNSDNHGDLQDRKGNTTLKVQQQRNYNIKELQLKEERDQENRKLLLITMINGRITRGPRERMRQSRVLAKTRLAIWLFGDQGPQHCEFQASVMDFKQWARE